jgi:hypothetical protein
MRPQRAWSQFESFCSHDGVAEFTDEDVASLLQFFAAEHAEGRFKDWKARLLRKAVLVLSEVASTGSYGWHLSQTVKPVYQSRTRIVPGPGETPGRVRHLGLTVATRNRR